MSVKHSFQSEILIIKSKKNCYGRHNNVFFRAIASTLNNNNGYIQVEKYSDVYAKRLWRVKESQIIAHKSLIDVVASKF